MKYRLLEVFKGGSLSRTELLENSKLKKIVRKSISKVDNREYGFIRWQSQYKRLQRYNQIFPEVFPKLLAVGFENSFYYFDLEYLEGFINLKDYMSNYTVEDFEVAEIAEKVFELANCMHSKIKFKSNPGVFDFYLQEECFNKFDDAKQNPLFLEFTKHRKIVFNDVQFDNLEKNQGWLLDFASQLKINNECYSHGNLTLENILYNPESKVCKFIDPYEENIIDCSEADFSQIKQCSIGHYGLLMKTSPLINLNKINIKYEIPQTFSAFNVKFQQLILENLNNYNHFVEDFLYASQFYRMLPFKIQSGNIEQAILFYGVACKLVHDLREKYE
jgi:hypothetical protein